MFDQPSRDIERLLQAAAEKRRQESGGPFELHPATRRLLHDEVSRTRRAAPGRAASDGFWQMLARLRFGFRLVASVVFLAGVAGLILWSSTRTVNREKLLAQTRVAAPGDAIAPEKQDFPAPATTPTAKPIAAAAPLADKRELAALARDADVSASTRPAQSPVAVAHSKDSGGSLGSATVRANAVVQPEVAEAFLAKTAASNLPHLKPAAGAPAPAASAVASQPPSDQPDALAAQMRAAAEFAAATQAELAQISRRASAASAKAKSTAVAAEPLANFQFVQSGNQLRVIDSDGSAYTGSIQVASAPAVLAAPVASATPRAEASQVRARSAGNARQSPAATTMGLVADSNAGIGGGRQMAEADATELPSEPSAPAQTYNFRVVGANRTLQQNVLFTGQLHLPANAAMNQSFTANSLSQQFQNATSPAGQQVPPSAANQSISNQALPTQNSMPLNQSRISGELRVGNRAPVPLEAQPLGP
jgi:hypothetical protein